MQHQHAATRKPSPLPLTLLMDTGESSQRGKAGPTAHIDKAQTSVGVSQGWLRPTVQWALG
jgi:hypothetical protein